MIRCRRCEVLAEKRPLVPGKRVCERCDLYRREDNRRRRAAKTANETKNRRLHGARPIEEVVAEADARREAHRAMIIEWPQRRGRIPMIREVGELIGVDGCGGYPNRVRREAFDLVAPLPRGPLTIPYPVPEQYRA